MSNTNQWIQHVLSQIKYPVSKPQDIVLGPGLITSCKDCEQEFGINQKVILQAGWTTSHKTCLRHLPAQVAVMFGTDEPEYGESIQKFMVNAIKRITADHWKGEPKDLSRPENAAVLQWLKNPTPVQKPSQQSIAA